MQDLVNGRAPFSLPLEPVHKGVRGFNPRKFFEMYFAVRDFWCILRFKKHIFMEGFPIRNFEIVGLRERISRPPWIVQY